MVLTRVVVTVERVFRLVMDSTSVSVSVMVVNPDGAWAVAMGAVAEGSAVTSAEPIEEGSEMVAGRLLGRSVAGSRLCRRPKPCRNMPPGCMATVRQTTRQWR
jgi:hypothetical protein